MRERERIPRILDKIKEKWEEAPDLRFGQLLINMRIVPDSMNVWSNEDDGLEEWLNKFEWDAK